MPEPQPDDQQVAGQQSAPATSRPAGDAERRDGKANGAAQLADDTATLPHQTGPTSAPSDPPPERWRGSAAIPPRTAAKRRRFGFWGRRGDARPDEPAAYGGAAPASTPRPPAEAERHHPGTAERYAADAELDAWDDTPAVDPWADAATWPDLEPEAFDYPSAPLPGPVHGPAPTWIDRPPTRIDQPTPPPATGAPSGWQNGPAPTRSQPWSPGPQRGPANPQQYSPPQYTPPQYGPAGPPALPAGPHPGQPTRPVEPAKRRRLRKDRRAREAAPVVPRPPSPPPQTWRPQPGHPRPARRRRRWPWGLMTTLLLTVGCCCGVPSYFGWPLWQQYPATAALPESVGDLTLQTDPADNRAVRTLKNDMRGEHLLAESTFAGIYGDPRGKRVTVFGVTGFRMQPESDLTAEINRLTDTYQLTEVEAVDPGRVGGYQRCGTGRDDGSTVVVCTWADHGSLGTALFTRRSVADSGNLLTRMRSSVITRR